MHNLTFQSKIFWDETKQSEIEVAKKYFDVSEITNEDLFDVSVDDIDQFRGSLTFAQKIKRVDRETDALRWAGKLRHEMLDPEFYFDTMEGIAFKWPSILEDEQFFIRPTSGSKIFAGNSYSEISFKKEMEFLKQRNIDPRTVVCLIAKNYSIREEYRTVFIDGEYISGSKYMYKSILDVDSYVPSDIIEYAKNIHKKYDLPSWTVLDVCYAGGYGNIYTIELNQFETSSFYLADLDKIYYNWSRKL